MTIRRRDLAHLATRWAFYSRAASRGRSLHDQRHETLDKGDNHSSEVPRVNRSDEDRRDGAAVQIFKDTD